MKNNQLTYGGIYLPSREQAIKTVIICQYLSNGYQPIHLFRYDRVKKQIYILAGTAESIEIIIYED